jgi:large subunit ribosomal protein L22
MDVARNGQIRGLSAEEAILQLKFSPKRRAEVVKKTVQNAINLADINYQIEPENLQVSECFVNKGHYLKRLRIMGRGRSGIMHHPHTHLTVVLREIDSSKKKLNRFQTKKLAREEAKQAAQKEEAQD